HSRLADVSINGLSAEKSHIVSPLQKFQNGFMNFRQWQGLVHCKLLKCQNISIKHYFSVKSSIISTIVSLKPLRPKNLWAISFFAATESINLSAPNCLAASIDFSI